MLVHVVSFQGLSMAPQVPPRPPTSAEQRKQLRINDALSHACDIIGRPYKYTEDLLFNLEVAEMHIRKAKVIAISKEPDDE